MTPLRPGAKSEISLVAIGICRQDHADLRSLRVRIDIDAPFVIEDGALDDRKSQPHSARLCCAKRREDFILQLRRNSLSVIPDSYDHATGALSIAQRLRAQGNFRFRLIGSRFS